MDALSGLPPVSKIRTLKGYADWMARLVGSNQVNTQYKLHAAGFDKGTLHKGYLAQIIVIYRTPSLPPLTVF